MSRLLAAPSLIALFLAACAVDGAGDPTGGDGEEPSCTGDKCDDLDGHGDAGGVWVENPCAIDLAVSLFEPRARKPFDTPPLVSVSIGHGRNAWFPGEAGDEIAIPDLGGTNGWRTIAYVTEPGTLALDPGYCPWDVFIESASLSDRAPDGGDWDDAAVGVYTRPDPYVEVASYGEADGCKGYATVAGTATSTAADTTTPSWNQEALSWVAWHDMSSSIRLWITDDDVGIGGETMGTCDVTGIPRADALPAVITTDCEGVGSVTIRIEPPDIDEVKTENVPVGGTCG